MYDKAGCLIKCTNNCLEVIKAARGIPPPSALPLNKMSGQTLVFWNANKLPVRPRPV
jgi:hypothetical protein